ncbi:MAG: hypothetical protein KW804_01730 [Candidatus Doudnabacteria bacterium]|nr:hypothetical protein [Candidatus Doudnabacteria bacterium]
MIKTYIIIGVVGTVMLGAVIYGFSIVGSPFKRQAIKTDQERMSDFTNLSYSVQTYFSKNQKLPEKLTDLTNFASYINDPDTNKPYEYSKVSDMSYKLCATFKLDSSEVKNSNDPYYNDYLYYDYLPKLLSVAPAYAQFTSPNSSVKTHKKGYDCITYTVPDSYLRKPTPPPYSPPVSTKPNIKLTYDGDVLKWDDVSAYDSATLNLKDAKGASLLQKNARGETVYRPTGAWKTAQIDMFIGGYYQPVSNIITKP